MFKFDYVHYSEKSSIGKIGEYSVTVWKSRAAMSALSEIQQKTELAYDLMLFGKMSVV